MKKSVLRGILLTLCVGLVCCLMVTGVIFDARYTGQTQQSLAALAASFAGHYDPQADAQAQAENFAMAMEGLRVTIVASDGTVLGDSTATPSAMENHAQREEIQEAAQGRVGKSVRNSATLGSALSKKLLYVAAQTPDGAYLRVALPYDGFWDSLLALLPALVIAGLVALAVAAGVADREARSVALPLAEFSERIKRVRRGGVALDPAKYPYPELQTMADDINRMSWEIAASMSRLAEEKQKISSILDNMNEALVMLDANRSVLLINDAACRVFGVNKAKAQGRPVECTTRNRALLDAIGEVLGGQGPAAVDVPLSAGRTGVAHISQVKADDTSRPGRGAILLLSDVTEQRNAVKMRQDFFESASHELKTPITSIKGFAELLCSGLVPDGEKQKEIYRRILKETTRMSSLIGDIIMISRLESGDITFEREPLDLAAVVKECCADAQAVAQAAGVTLTCRTVPCVHMASRREMDELVGNLVQNAVKYNHPGGQVDVTLTDENGAVRLTVFNTGEPIAPEHRQRIFERFYRIDKGRSKAAGGTGLGLAIVKHIATGYGAAVSLEVSEQGNTFAVQFPAE